MLGGVSNTIDLKKFRLKYGWADKNHRLSGLGATILVLISFTLGLWSHAGTKLYGLKLQGGLTFLLNLLAILLIIPVVSKLTAKKAT